MSPYFPETQAFFPGFVRSNLQISNAWVKYTKIELDWNKRLEKRVVNVKDRKKCD